MQKYIDLSHSIENGMPVFPGDRDVLLEQTHSVEKYGSSNYHLNTELHIGTHIDSPAHFVKNGTKIADLAIENFFGRGVLINANGRSEIGIECIDNINIEENDIVVIYTEYYKNWEKSDYFINYPVISDELCNEFISKKIKMICLDTPSPDKSPYKIHKLLLKNNILIAENLTNTEELINLREFEIIALPIKILSCGAPARIIAKYND